MWEIPWWGALIMAWAAGNIGFLLGAVFSLGRQEEEVGARLRAEDGRWARSRANAPRRL
jgi:hypothetical protein